MPGATNPRSIIETLTAARVAAAERRLEAELMESRARRQGDAKALQLAEELQADSETQAEFLGVGIAAFRAGTAIEAECQFAELLRTLADLERHGDDRSLQGARKRDRLLESVGEWIERQARREAEAAAAAALAEVAGQ